MTRFPIAVLCGAALLAHAADPPTYEVSPIGWVRKADGRTTIEIDRAYQPAML